MAPWRQLPGSPDACPRQAVHVIRLSLDPSRLPDDSSDLDLDELARAGRYVVEPPRRRFRICRRGLRRCLGWFTKSLAREIRFASERNGKPTLAHPKDTGLRFNVSHSGDWGVIAVSWERTLGVDIESIDPNLDGAALASRFFSEHERAELLSLPPEDLQDGFYRLWTTKEAYIKAIGLGMAVPLGSFSAAANPRREPRLVGGDVREGPWRACGFQVAPGVPGVVMWDGGPAPVCFWDAFAGW
ncbi:MAG: 4'-phosphopantetheinyl transferase superfamily protein [Planctomycetaceae bacterium]|nr:4'-phosphopantetheinyl transferase superfamily protein [Planctomycetaceae bacterium]